MDIDHRQIAVQLFNRCWELLEAPRSPERDDELERTAFASLFHWAKVGTAKNIAIGEWMIAHVYLELNLLSEAERFARRVIVLCQAKGLEDFHLAYGYLEMARICRKRIDSKGEVEKWLDLAKAVEITDPHDREHFQEDLQNEERT
ncbi:MAG TPA: hypothetical protein VJ835_09155 [Fimbriimonadaceae bacterium]|nr:hypothetical protein [Fimbriimonadaceae bacterium]